MYLATAFRSFQIIISASNERNVHFKNPNIRKHLSSERCLKVKRQDICKQAKNGQIWRRT